ncbi:MAG: tRNA pseudouridine(38-40) synthase TruA [Sphaerochaetaceae bacterium]|nr:tRNA pseudouridine(38-40) synthase TruA [Sphaerochaetaceae bacterium]
MARSDWNRPEEFGAPEGRERVAIELSYDGRAFCGWQSQKEEASVQSTIKNAVCLLLGFSPEEVEVVGSGRTDSGVHGYGQVAHIEIPQRDISINAFSMGLNSKLPYSVRIKRAWNVDRTFHARYSAMAREYRYFIREGLAHDSFQEGLVTRVQKLPSIDLLNSYAKVLIGTHDFTTFCSAQDQCPSKFRDIYESEFFVEKNMYQDNLYCFRIVGNAFLYHMVRSLVGSMLCYGKNGASKEEFEACLNSKDRSKAGTTAPSDGLYLWRVSYDPEEYLWFEKEYGHD